MPKLAGSSSLQQQEPAEFRAQTMNDLRIKEQKHLQISIPADTKQQDHIHSTHRHEA